MAEPATAGVAEPADEPLEDAHPAPGSIPVVPAASAAEPPPHAAPAAESASPADPLSRDFGEQAAETESGEHLTFGFENEAAAETQAEALGGDVRVNDDWEIGGETGEFRRPTASFPETAWRDRSATWSSYRAATPEKKSTGVAAAAFERPPRASKPFLRDRTAKTHSATLFLSVFILVVIGYGLISMVVVGAPAASADFFGGLPIIGNRFARPALAASLVALADVKATYAHLRDGRSALVIAGTARNVGPEPLDVVEIGADLRGSGPRPLAHTQGYCGTNLSPAMVSQMTPREIEFLEGIGPAHDFSLAPEDRCSFALVFLNPPQTARHFSLIVARAAAKTAGAGSN